MFIFNQDINQQFLVKEEDDNKDIKPSCEVHGGNLFVQLHFKAIQSVPDTAELINTVVTSKDESSAKFAGYGKHVIAARAKEEDDIITKENAYKYIKAYVSVMFGQDVGNSLTMDDIQVILENGEIATPEQLKQWDEQQKNKDKDSESTNESILSFRRFLLEDEKDIEDEESGYQEEDEFGGDGEEAEEGGDGEEAEEGGDGEEAEEGGDGEEAEEGGEEIPPPATFLITYNIEAKGQPEKDHTDPKDLEKIDKKFKLPGINLPNLGLEFGTIGGGATDTIDLKKLGKDISGKIDSDELEVNIRNIFKSEFSDIPIPSISVRDKRTLDIELKKKFENDETGQYNAKVQKQISESNYSLYITVSDYREKPLVEKSDILDIINKAIKQTGGRWVKFMSGIKEDNIIMLKTLKGKSSFDDLPDDLSEKSPKEKLLKQVPTDEEIKKIIYPNKNDKADKSNNIWENIDKLFKDLSKANAEYKESTVDKIIALWNNFKKKHNSSDKIGEKEYNEFYTEYSKYYKDNVAKYLSESYQTERQLLSDLFGYIYEDDGNDFESDLDDIGLDGSDKSNSDKSKSNNDDYIEKIFIIPMPNLEKSKD